MENLENVGQKVKKPSVLKRLSAFMGKKKILMPISLICSGGSAVLNILPMIFAWQIIKMLLSGNSVNMQAVISYAVYASIFAIAGIIVYFMALMSSHLAAFQVEINLKKQGFEKTMKMPLGFFNKNLSGKLRKVINDGSSATHTFLAHELPDFAAMIISPIILLAMFFIFDWRMGIACLIPVILSFVTMSSMMTPKGKKLQGQYFTKLEEMSAESVEYVRGIPVVKTFGRSVHSFTRFYNSIMSYKELSVQFTTLWTNPMSLYSVLVHIASFFLIPLAILLIGKGENIGLVISNFVLYLLIAPQFGSMIMKSMFFQQNMQVASRALDNYEAVLSYPILEETKNAIKFENQDIEFKSVSFRYEGTEKDAVDCVSFKIEKGKTLALVGASGGGKTTIARLCARFWDATSGEILIGGHNIKDYSKKELMDNIAFVFQNNKLFKTSLRENLLLGNTSTTEDQINTALENARAKEIVDGLEKGLETIMGTKGTYLSGGEQQRIALARAFIKNAPIVILDEATAFADPENEHLIQAALKELGKGKTTLMIAHRLTTVKDADAIAVINEGKISEYGTHDELIAKNGLYKKMWEEYQAGIEWRV